MSEAITRDQFREILTELGNVTQATQTHLDQVNSLERTIDSHIESGWWDEFEEELSWIKDMFETQIKAEAIGKRMGGEPLDANRLVELANSILTLHAKLWERTQADAEELSGAMLLFERNVSRPEVLQDLLSHENDNTPEELVELALQPPPKVRSIAIPGEVDDRWVADHCQI